MKKTITTAIAAVALLTLAACGSGKANEAVANEARPTVTVTAPAEPAPPAPTVTVTVSTSSVPQSCLDALDNAETGFGYAADAITAAGEFDVAGLNEATRKTTALAPTWSANKAACRAAGN